MPTHATKALTVTANVPLRRNSWYGIFSYKLVTAIGIESNESVRDTNDVSVALAKNSKYDLH